MTMEGSDMKANPKRPPLSPIRYTAVLAGLFFLLTGCPGNTDDSSGDTTPPDAIGDLAVLSSGTAPSGLRLAFTAVGDDGQGNGPAASYEVRVSQSAFNAATWDSASVYAQAWTPAAPGSAESFDLAGLVPSTLYYFGVRVFDDSNNGSGVSAIVSATSASSDLPPGTVTDLAASPSVATEGGIGLSWTAPGADGASGGAVASYEVRTSASPIDDGNWSSATVYAQSWSPLAQGQTENRTLTGLTPGSTYYVALKSRDAGAQESSLSNVVSAAAWSDTTAPAAITDLVAVPGTAVGSIDLSWTATGDDGSIGTASAYDVRYATSPITSGNYAAATVFTQSWTPQASGSAETGTITGLTAGTGYYVAIKAIDNQAIASAISNVPNTTASTYLTIVVGQQNPAGSTSLGVGQIPVLQLLVTNTAAEDIDISVVSLTDGGTAQLSSVHTVFFLRDEGTTPGVWDVGDTYIENTLNTFSGNTVTIPVSPVHTIPSGSQERWLVVYDIRQASAGTYQPTFTPSAHVTATGAVSATSIVASGATITGDTFSFPAPLPTAWYGISASGGPGTLVDHTAVTDGPNSRMLFFGGQTGGGAGSETNAVHALSVGTLGGEAWTTLSPANTLPGARHGHAAVYDSLGLRMIVIGGIDATSATLNDVWALDTNGGGNGSWTQLTPGGTGPTGLAHASAVYDANTDSVILFGGQDGSGTFQNNTWVLSLGATPAWTLQPTTNTPATRIRHVAAFDPTSNNMMVYSGLGPSGFPPPMSTPYRNDTVLLNVTTWQWTTVYANTSQFHPRYGAACAYDSANRRAWIFGGLGGSNLAGQVQDVGYFDFSANTIAGIVLTGTPHGAGSGAAGAYDPVNSRFVVHGGGAATTDEVR